MRASFSFESSEESERAVDDLRLDAKASAALLLFSGRADFHYRQISVTQQNEVKFRLRYLQEEPPVIADVATIQAALVPQAKTAWHQPNFFEVYGDYVKIGYIPYKSLDLDYTVGFHSSDAATSFASSISASTLTFSLSNFINALSSRQSMRKSTSVSISATNARLNGIAVSKVLLAVNDANKFQAEVARLFRQYAVGSPLGAKSVMVPWENVMTDPYMGKRTFDPSASNIDAAATAFASIDQKMSMLADLVNGFRRSNRWLPVSKKNELQALLDSELERIAQLKSKWAAYIADTSLPRPQLPSTSWNVPYVKFDRVVPDRNDLAGGSNQAGFYVTGTHAVDELGNYGGEVVPSAIVSGEIWIGGEMIGKSTYGNEQYRSDTFSVYATSPSYAVASANQARDRLSGAVLLLKDIDGRVVYSLTLPG